MSQRNPTKKKEFGDFQTPIYLANKIVSFLKQSGLAVSTILEPTCGTGSFVLASLNHFPDARIIGMDINELYLQILERKINELDNQPKVTIEKQNFFEVDWQAVLGSLKKPLLIIGNPPWVTSSEIGLLNGSNLPQKSNIHDFSGFDSKTGKSNFDISEWMLITLLSGLNGFNATLAMLCKLSVARKVFRFVNKEQISITSSDIYLIDAKKYFNVTVDACLFVCKLQPFSHNYTCKIHENLHSNKIIQEIGYINQQLVANIPLYKKLNHLHGESIHTWRSGIKHDCVKVMELREKNNKLYNGFGELVSIEDTYLYPMLKGSDLANNRVNNISRWMLVTQTKIGEKTASIKEKAPKTWEYLEKYSDELNQRASTVYQNKPKYSIFGVGDYSFSLWKIGIAGLYKQLDFRLIKPFNGKPVVLDDTCYFLPANSLAEAIILHVLYNHKLAVDFYKSFIFWDSKRPITKGLLKKLDLVKLIEEIKVATILKIIEREYPEIASDTAEFILNKFLRGNQKDELLINYF
ncbi:MAG: SAM-dependent methyltransferase [Candidatus Heimdallarchaeota archaeon]|nr:SAM-dependent methyltransferase [Candidatus Heimdallarchaeota archaeon]